jgi:hypothetical protein
MSTTYTPNVKLGQPALGDTGWSTPLNNNCTTLDGLAPVGGLAVSPHEVPSASLTVAVAAGQYINQAGIAITYAGSASQAVTANATNYLYLTNSGTLTVNTTGWPAGPTLYTPLAIIVAGASTITSVTDARVCLPVVGAGFLPLGGGTLTDGANIVLGSTTGTEIGTATGQKLGFYGKTPVIQQTGGAATASSSYTSVEQGMLNAAYSALRALGLLS